MAALPQVARISLKDILFPTDFSPASEAALRFALTLARIYGSRLYVAHVILPESHPQVLSPKLSQQENVWDDANERLDEFARHPSVGDVHFTSLLASGGLGEVIPGLIQEHNIDLVVLGTRGRRGVSRIMLGSSAEGIYRSAPCPVLTVGPHVRVVQWQLRRILCPVDLEGNPEPAVQYALSLARDNDAEFVVLNAVPMVPWQHRAEVEKQARADMRSVIDKENPDSARGEVQMLVRWEPPAEAILQCAVDREIDLIVMGVRRSRAAGLSSHLPWPIASEVVSRALCPVLTVRI
jgi:nucleotide-binding universal stress UspA family protein